MGLNYQNLSARMCPTIETEKKIKRFQLEYFLQIIWGVDEL
jgi:hypothetical protein